MAKCHENPARRVRWVPVLPPYLRLYSLADPQFGCLALDTKLPGGHCLTHIGREGGTDFSNSFGWSIGAAYSVTQPLAVFGFLEGSTAISPGQPDPVELRVGAEYRLTKGLKFTGSVTRGLTDGAADWGVSGGLTYRF